MLDQIRNKIKQSAWGKVGAFVLLYALVYTTIWAAAEPLNLDIATDNKQHWRYVLIIGTLIITFIVYSVLLIEYFQKKTSIEWLKKILKTQYLKTKRGYLAYLEKNFNQMPFIYQGINMVDPLTIKNDHVAASYAYHPLKLLPSNEMRVYTHNDTSDEFQDTLMGCANSMLNKSSRILLLGHAGIGKTTFLQHSILSIINKMKDFYPLIDKKGLIPIFVPLKVLDNETISPILKYINTIPYFSGKKGFKKLLKLAREKKIVLFLDGYDEIKTNKKSKNTIINELNILFSRVIFNNLEKNELFKELYNLLTAHNSIWLTSRLSYFFESPLELVKNQNEIRRNIDFFVKFTNNEIKDLNNKFEVVGSILIKGVQEKNKLISKLIDRYKKKDLANASSLTPNMVFNFIEKHFDANSEEVTNSPLFLTIFFLHLY